ncbi:hypothetical protein [Leadbettera azotonutricia]|uniref:hypothetical protein n=1 Tax=Leadbettera azotonutricia TaxID=150829 RepID=UPI001FE0A561|nr:hypothetical protein [Leadbettera azotonutricia]
MKIRDKPLFICLNQDTQSTGDFKPQAHCKLPGMGIIQNNQGIFRLHGQGD